MRLTFLAQSLENIIFIIENPKLWPIPLEPIPKWRNVLDTITLPPFTAKPFPHLSNTRFTSSLEAAPASFGIHLGLFLVFLRVFVHGAIRVATLIASGGLARLGS